MSWKSVCHRSYANNQSLAEANQLKQEREEKITNSDNKLTQMSQLKQNTFSKAIVYGTISYQLGQNKKSSDKSTHRWCVYVRSPNGEDLSTFIDKVYLVAFHKSNFIFKMNAAITKPPFEVSEKGWGEFDILIQIHFKTHYPHLEFVHKLKFYGTKTGGSSQSSKKPVVSEFYDEIVFVNPSEEFSEFLKEVKMLNINGNQDKKESSQMEEEVAGNLDQNKIDDEEKFDWKQHYQRFDANDHTMKLEDALAVIKLENDKCKGECDKYDSEIEALKLEIDALQKELDAAQAISREEQEKKLLLLDQEALLPPPPIPHQIQSTQIPQKPEQIPQPIYYPPGNEQQPPFIQPQQQLQQMRPPRNPSSASNSYLPPQQQGTQNIAFNQAPLQQQQQMLAQNQYPPPLPQLPPQ